MKRRQRESLHNESMKEYIFHNIFCIYYIRERIRIDSLDYYYIRY